MPLHEPVQAAIWDSLNNYAYDDAIFLSERLYAEVNNNETLYLLATSYYRAKHRMQAYMLLMKKGCPTPQCKLLMARCCMETRKYAEAVQILTGYMLVKSRSFEEIEAEFGASACHVFTLLGEVYRKTDQIQKAIDCYKKSLKLNPLQWKSFEALCNLGAKVDPDQVFSLPASMMGDPQGLVLPSSAELPQSTPLQHTPQSLVPVSSQPVAEEAAFAMPHVDSNVTTTPAAVETTVTPHMIYSEITPENQMQDMRTADVLLSAPLRPARPLNTEKQCHRSMLSKILFPASYLSPSFGVMTLETASDLDTNPSALPFISPNPMPILPDDAVLDANDPSKKVGSRDLTTVLDGLSKVVTQKQSAKPPVFSLSENSNTRDVSGQPQTGNAPNVRRSARLFGNSSSVKENKKSQGKSRFASPKEVGRKSKTRSKSLQERNELKKNEAGTDTKPPGSHLEMLPTSDQIFHMQQQSMGGMLKLLQGVGRAYAAFSQYDCQLAVQLFEDLPEHQHTSWILSHIARAYFNKGEFQKAASVFRDVHSMEPYQEYGMDYYSTALWHLQREVELSALAHDLSDLDRSCPQTLCATGNCFSLQKEHDVAIKFFKRAIQVDPDYAYAYTLLAHEYVFIDELDNGLGCFRNALRVDSRHYIAWYGVGMIYYKQEKYKLAEFYFRRAQAINPQNSALLCYVGMVQHAQKKTEQALVTMDQAIAQDPNSSLCKFHRASMLLACDRHQEALQELEELKKIVPKESLIYFLIGKVHKKLGNSHLALMNFSWATVLDPMGLNNQIKEAIDKHNTPDDDVIVARLTESLPGVLVESGGDHSREPTSSILNVMLTDDISPDHQLEIDENW